MRKQVFAVAALSVLFAGPVLAEDTRVPGAALEALGLGGMKAVSDEQGMSVRGMSSNAQGSSMSVFSFALFDPGTGNNLSGTGGQFSRGTAENAGPLVPSTATAFTTNVFAGTTLTVSVPPAVYVGTVGVITIVGTVTATGM